LIDAEKAIDSDPLLFTEFNPYQLRCINKFTNKPNMLISAAPNGIGKTFVPVALMGAIMFGSANPLFAGAVFKNWPFPKQLRFVSTTVNVSDNEAFQTAIQMLWPRGEYRMKRGGGKGYYSEIQANDFTVDVLSFNQPRLEHASGTKGLVVASEPCPDKRIISENLARLRAGGIFYWEMTPINYAPYAKDDYLDKGGLFDEQGREVGTIVAVPGNVHENCRQCTKGGQLDHKQIEAVIASYPYEEREARREGSFMHQAGLIYQLYGDLNEINEFPKYHQECWDKGKYNLAHVMDPHDRKPFALGWYAIFPNDDVIAIAEYPNIIYHETHSTNDTVESYRAVIVDTNKDLDHPIDRMLIDPNFGNTPKLGDLTVKQLFARPCLDCKDAKKEDSCGHRLLYTDPPDSIVEGHMLVRNAIGNPKEDKRPKFFILKPNCPNHCYAMRHYGFKEEKNPDQRGPGTQPLLVHKDYPDLVRYLYNFGATYREPSGPLRLVKMKKRGRGTHAT
ncbi:hypothetical protein LCGC14_0914970, partial [marine sediment metagenome]